jgi:adenine deaminase
MTNEDGIKVAEKYDALNKKAKELGCSFHAPFMTLAFMSLLVIPEIKIGDKGLFDVTSFNFIPIFENGNE